MPNTYYLAASNQLLSQFAYIIQQIHTACKAHKKYKFHDYSKNSMKHIETTKNSIKILLSFKVGDVVYVDDNLDDLFKKIIDALAYRSPLSVTEYICYPANLSGSSDVFDLCPKCSTPIDRGYQQFCSACGQHLRWINPKKMKLFDPNQKC